MPVVSDTVLGLCYMAPQAFLDRAGFFGAQTAIAGKTAEELVPLAAMASRAIDAHCGREFSPASIIETHRWNPYTRRISVNQPPVMTLSSFKFITGPDQEFSFNVADVLVNNQENYLELASLAGIDSVVFESIAGITEPQIEVTYLSYGSIPQKVVAACGFTMAKMANEAYSSSQVPDGLVRVKLPAGLDVARRSEVEDGGLIPPMAKQLLQGYVRFAVG